MKTILVPTDFSTQASYAVEVASEIARYNNGEITLLHILEAPFSGTVSTTGEYVPKNDDDFYIVKLLQKAKTELQRIVLNPKFKDLDIKTKVKVGNPYKGISEEIVSNEVSLIVMGSKGTSGIEELLVGSNTEKVVRLAPCPVITVKSKPEDFKIRNIVFASDFNDLTSIAKLKKFQEMFFAKLHLLFVNTPHDFTPTEVVNARMNSFIKHNDLDNYTVNVYDAYTPKEGILQFANQIKADVIAMGTHGRTGFLHFVIGSITEDVVNHSRSLIFTFHLNDRSTIDIKNAS